MLRREGGGERRNLLIHNSKTENANSKTELNVRSQNFMWATTHNSKVLFKERKSALKYNPRACESVKLHEAIKKEKRKGKEKERAVC